MDMITAPIRHDNGRILPILRLILPDFSHDVIHQIGDLEQILDGIFGIFVSTEILVKLGMLHHMEYHVLDEESLQGTFRGPGRVCEGESGEVRCLTQLTLSPSKTQAYMIHDCILQFLHTEFIGHAIGSGHITNVKGGIGALRDLAPVDPIDNDGKGLGIVFGQVDFVLVSFVEAALL